MNLLRRERYVGVHSHVLLPSGPILALAAVGASPFGSPTCTRCMTAGPDGETAAPTRAARFRRSIRHGHYRVRRGRHGCHVAARVAVRSAVSGRLLRARPDAVPTTRRCPERRAGLGFPGGSRCFFMWAMRSRRRTMPGSSRYLSDPSSVRRPDFCCSAGHRRTGGDERRASGRVGRRSRRRLGVRDDVPLSLQAAECCCCRLLLRGVARCGPGGMRRRASGPGH